jgi:thioredoxin-like negative regulator of GroEL
MGVRVHVQKVIESKEPVIVCCIAEWCGDIAGVLAKAVGGKPGVKLGVLDAERHSDFATNSLRIENLPTTYLFHNGKALDKVVGSMGQQQVAGLVNKAAALLGKQEPGAPELLTEAGKLLTEGKVEEALQVYMAVLQQSKDKHGASAYAGMALCALAVQGQVHLHLHIDAAHMTMTYNHAHVPYTHSCAHRCFTHDLQSCSHALST